MYQILILDSWYLVLYSMHYVLGNVQVSHQCISGEGLRQNADTADVWEGGGRGQGGIKFEISWEPNFPVNNFARNNGKNFVIIKTIINIKL